MRLNWEYFLGTIAQVRKALMLSRLSGRAFADQARLASRISS